MDGIDAALVKLGERRCTVMQTLASPYPDELRETLIRFSQAPGELSIDDFGQLDRAVGEAFRDAALELLSLAKVAAKDIQAIGSHGQTLRHRPDGRYPFTLQIGDPNVIASGTGITTVADFRRRDVALGGEGAPLAPAFHRWLFAEPGRSRIILNLGGIANVTLLPAADEPVIGFDTGPANSLMDAWIREARGERFDAGGAWAASGTVDHSLLEAMLADPYFAAPAPKSTGFEYFNFDWLKAHLDAKKELSAADVQATLLELTVTSIRDAIVDHTPDLQEVLVCGGGASNDALMARLANCLDPVSVSSTAAVGLDPDWVEAAAFAWLASRTLAGQAGNLPSVTGASEAQVLGGIYPGIASDS